MDAVVTSTEPDLKELQARYQLLVDDWIAAIHREAALSAAINSVENLDAWEAAYFSQSAVHDQVKLAEGAYEDGLRSKFYHF